MAKKTPMDRLSVAIQDVLNEYCDEVTEDMEAAVKKVAQAGAKAVRAESKSKFGGTGKYASGWKAKVEPGRLGATAVIYNAKAPGLPHLLEHGHAKRGGGRVSGRAHIKPVEEQIIRQFEGEVRRSI